MASYDSGPTTGWNVLLFGGCTGLSAGGCLGVASDTWEYAAGTWTQMIGSPTPPARYLASMSWDSRDNEIVMAAGCGGTGPLCPTGAVLPDTWAWTGTSWRIVIAPALTARYGAAMADNPIGDNVILYGGCKTGGASCTGPSAGTWSFAAGTWTHVSANSAPGTLIGASMSAPVAGGPLMMFGGCNAPGSSAPWTCATFAPQATWTWAGPVWHWARVFPTYQPVPGMFAAMAIDPGDGYSVYLDGCLTPLLCQSAGPWTWTYALTVWNDIGGFIPAGVARFGVSIAYDAQLYTGSSTLGAVLAFGGCLPAGGSCPLGQTWQYIGDVWTLLSPARSPPARFDAAMAYDAADGYVLLFGGCSIAPTAGGCPTVNLLGDYWEFVAAPAGGGSWTNLCTGTCVSPVARFAMSMVYAPTGTTGYVLLFGGYGCTNPPACTTAGVLGDTWQYFAGTWTPTSVTGAPSARSGYGATYDGAIFSPVVFGGYDGATVLNDAYYYTPGKTGSGTWTSLTPTGATPPARFQPGLAYDPSTGDLVLFGGCTSGSVPCPGGLPASVLADTWEATVSTTVGSITWTQVSTSFSPPARSDPAMTYDSIDGYTLLFGGSTIVGPAEDTWTYSGGTWALVA